MRRPVEYPAPWECVYCAAGWDSTVECEDKGVCVCVCVGVKREARAMTTQPGIGHCSGAFVVGLPRKRDEGDA